MDRARARSPTSGHDRPPPRSGALDLPAVGRPGRRLRRLVAAAARRCPTRCRATAPAQWAGVFYALALVANYPHYMATVYRAYGAADRSAHRLYTVYATAVLIALGVVAHADLRLLPSLFTAYVMWSPWHYTGQNYGLLMMFARRGRADGVAGAGPASPPGLRRLVRDAAGRVQRGAVVGSDGAVARSAVSASRPPSAGWPVRRSSASASGTLWPLVRGAGAATAAPLTAVHHPGPVVRRRRSRSSWTTSAATPQTRYSSGILAVMHSAQYLWITQYFARREQGAAWQTSRYWCGGRPRRPGAVPADPVAGQLRCPRGLHRQRADRHRGRQPAPLHDRRRGLEAARPAGRRARSPTAPRRAGERDGPRPDARCAGGTRGGRPWPRSRWWRWRPSTSGAIAWPCASADPAALAGRGPGQPVRLGRAGSAAAGAGRSAGDDEALRAHLERDDRPQSCATSTRW